MNTSYHYKEQGLETCGIQLETKESNEIILWQADMEFLQEILRFL
jgi:hypothetical protein